MWRADRSSGQGEGDPAASRRADPQAPGGPSGLFACFGEDLRQIGQIGRSRGSGEVRLWRARPILDVTVWRKRKRRAGAILRAVLGHSIQIVDRFTARILRPIRCIVCTAARSK